MTTKPDPRTHAWRDDLADARLEGVVAAERYVEGQPGWIGVPVADVHAKPDPTSGMATQLLYGMAVSVFQHAGGWAWVQAAHDGYVGYVRDEAVRDGARPATHRVAMPRTVLYGKPDLKTPRTLEMSMGSGVTIVGEDTVRGTHYALLMNGHSAIRNHLKDIDNHATDYVAVAETCLNTPYLWGGASGFGLDCSGLVQLSMMMAGKTVMRDSDQQAETIGDPISEAEPLRRGDLVFWNGHVGIMADTETLIHANAHTMTVAHEPLAAAIERIGYLYGQPTGYRRP